MTLVSGSAVYAAAGADSLFVPGLVDPAAIAELPRDRCRSR